MLSVIIPTEGVEQPAVATLAALVPGAAAGIIREVILVDRGGSGVIERVADVAGCRYLAAEGTRAAALAAGPAPPSSAIPARPMRNGGCATASRRSRAWSRAHRRSRAS